MCNLILKTERTAEKIKKQTRKCKGEKKTRQIENVIETELTENRKLEEKRERKQLYCSTSGLIIW